MPAVGDEKGNVCKRVTRIVSIAQNLAGVHDFRMSASFRSVGMKIGMSGVTALDAHYARQLPSNVSALARIESQKLNTKNPARFFNSGELYTMRRKKSLLYMERMFGKGGDRHVVVAREHRSIVRINSTPKNRPNWDTSATSSTLREEMSGLCLKGLKLFPVGMRNR